MNFFSDNYRTDDLDNVCEKVCAIFIVLCNLALNTFIQVRFSNILLNIAIVVAVITIKLSLYSHFLAQNRSVKREDDFLLTKTVSISSNTKLITKICRFQDIHLSQF